MLTKLCETLARIHPEADVFIRQVIMIPHNGHLIIYDAGNEAYLANVIADTVKWAHPIDYDVTRLAALQPRPVRPEENIGSCVAGPDMRRPLWDKTQGTWHTDVDKVGRYSVSRPAKRMPYHSYLNGNDLGLMPDADPEVLKRSIDRRILEARRINAVHDTPHASLKDERGMLKKFDQGSRDLAILNRLNELGWIENGPDGVRLSEVGLYWLPVEAS